MSLKISESSSEIRKFGGTLAENIICNSFVVPFISVLSSWKSSVMLAGRSRVANVSESKQHMCVLVKVLPCIKSKSPESNKQTRPSNEGFCLGEGVGFVESMH